MATNDNPNHLADPGMAALEAAQQQASQPEALLEWEASEYAHYEKGRTWYLIAGVLALAVIGYAIVSESYMEAVAMALLAGVVYLYSHELPSRHRIQVNKLGVQVGEQFFPYTVIRSFWLVLTPELRQLHLETTVRFGQILTIQLEDTDPILVRKVLAMEVQEASGRSEGFIDKLARLLKL